MVGVAAASTTIAEEVSTAVGSLGTSAGGNNRLLITRRSKDLQGQYKKDVTTSSHSI